MSLSVSVLLRSTPPLDLGADSGQTAGRECHQLDDGTQAEYNQRLQSGIRWENGAPRLSLALPSMQACQPWSLQCACQHHPLALMIIATSHARASSSRRISEMAFCFLYIAVGAHPDRLGLGPAELRRGDI